MATPDPSKIVAAWGRLSHSPTSLATAYPHGGTAIATCDKPTFEWHSKPDEIRSHSFGGALVDLVYQGEDCSVATVLREVLDPAALAAVFPIFVTGAQGGPVLRADANSSVRAGSLLGDLAVVLVFTPANEDMHPWLIVRRGVPALQQTARMVMSTKDELSIPIVWHATPDSSGRQYEWGKRRDITL